MTIHDPHGVLIRFRLLQVSFDAKLADGHLAQAQMIPKDFGGAANVGHSLIKILYAPLARADMKCEHGTIA